MSDPTDPNQLAWPAPQPEGSQQRPSAALAVSAPLPAGYQLHPQNPAYMWNPTTNDVQLTPAPQQAPPPPLQLVAPPLPPAYAAALPHGYQLHPQNPAFMWNPATNDVRPSAPPIPYGQQPGYGQPSPTQPFGVNVMNSNMANATNQARGSYQQLKSPGVAALLSFLFVGAGQLYNGHAGKAILMFFGCILLWFVFLGWIVNIWSIVDAYSSADAINRGAA
jgi:TM2 domain-containing membrane protein YozV